MKRSRLPTRWWSKGKNKQRDAKLHQEFLRVAATVKYTIYLDKIGIDAVINDVLSGGDASQAWIGRIGPTSP
jgi:hypothetical protein